MSQQKDRTFPQIQHTLANKYFFVLFLSSGSAGYVSVQFSPAVNPAGHGTSLSTIIAFVSYHITNQRHRLNVTTLAQHQMIARHRDGLVLVVQATRMTMKYYENC